MPIIPSKKQKTIVSNQVRPAKISSRPTVQPPMTAQLIPAIKEPVEPGITVLVPQGLGDIFWVYQKLAPHFDRINFRIGVMNDSEISKRSEDWLNLLPKVGSVKTTPISDGEYRRLIESKIRVQDVMDAWNRGKNQVKYCCNRFLEDGTRIDKIDKYAIDQNIPMLIEPFDLPFTEYVSLYISGSTKPNIMASHNVWPVSQWVDFILEIYKSLNLNYPIIMVGATFDEDVILDTVNQLKEEQINVVPFIQKSPAQVCHILKQSKMFIGYQSGLNIVADNLDVPQIMLYFPILAKMQYTWCKHENITTRFHAALFTDDKEVIIRRIQPIKNYL
jgi:hypothetical protein